MKTKLLSILPFFTAMAFAQGPLQPSTAVDPRLGPVAPLNGAGAPQPTMRTLYQVEPRTPLVSGSPGVTVAAGGNITISRSGSYYLTANVALATGDGINISSFDGPVSVDLNGFTISTNSAATGNGIIANTNFPVAISNGNINSTGVVSVAGTISGSSFQYGIHVFSPNQATVSKVNISGIANKAIYLDRAASSVIDSCTARDCVNGFEGAMITNCIATEIGKTAIVGELVSHCVGKSYTGDGIFGLVVNNSMGQTKNTATNSVAGGIRTEPLNAGLVTSSRGIGTSNSFSIQAHTAVGCTYNGETGIIFRYNMPPP